MEIQKEKLSKQGEDVLKMPQEKNKQISPLLMRRLLETEQRTKQDKEIGMTDPELQFDSFLLAQKIIGETMEKMIESGLPTHVIFDINSVLAQIKVQVIPETFNKQLNYGGIQIKMASLKETAKAYETKKTKNIAELASVPVDLELYQESGKDQAGKPYSYHYVELSGIRYRVPDSVIEQIKSIIQSKPNVKSVKVNSTGTGMNTKYNTFPLD